MITDPPSGTRDFLPAEMRMRQGLFRAIHAVFVRYGFEPIDTPAFERLEILMGKYGEEGEKLIFKILRRGERGEQAEADYALRYDLTVPLSRVYARYQNELPRPFRRYQVGPVWRADRPGRGRFRELFQCDLDIVGAEAPLAEVEVMSALAQCYWEVGLRKFTFHVNSRKVLMAILEGYQLPAEQHTSVTIALDKVDKVGAEGVAKELVERGIAADKVATIRADLASTDASDRARSRAALTEHGRTALAELDEISRLLAPVLPESATIRFAPFLARGLDYYTGCIFEIYHPDLPLAIGAGGRYDNLLASFAEDKSIPACGGSLGIDRVMLLVQQSNQTTPARSQVMVGVFGQLREEALAIAKRLRRSEISTEVYCGAGGNLGKQLKAASQLKVQAFVMQGPDEKAQDSVMVKFLATGKQETCKLADLTRLLAATLPQT
jgi:histidyl-tRNA synthetase